MTTYIYKCYKCNTGPRIEQCDDEPEREMYCQKCRRKLFRCHMAPGVCTDSTFMAGSHSDDGFGSNEWGRRTARAKAAAAGVDISGARYCPQLNAPGESLSPRAWVRDKSDVRRRAAELGCGCEGQVSAAAPIDNTPDPGPYRANDTVVNRRVEKQLTAAGESKKTIGDKSYKDLWHKEQSLASGNT